MVSRPWSAFQIKPQLPDTLVKKAVSMTQIEYLNRKENGSTRSPNFVIRHLLTDLIMRAKLLQSPEELDQILRVTVPRLQKACRYQDDLLSEKQVAERWEFLNVIKLRNMRARNQGPVFLKFGKSRNSRIYYRIADIESWIIRHEQLQTKLPLGD